ncbi:hypothetical protein [Tumebacillus flagellatus]|uniref:Uncharacterized protein n=1 Tax=Tumebacillus flagellatus TaxID=1157490 RepID=A0A074LF32_9BACL|nr:hypothetical protein [Tumebacillus flagellatus]KEO80856.1 hypothetical protein EL26_24055 [Tumebacillus flagellatus]
MDHFSIQAARREKVFIKRLTAGLTYRTGTGRQNKIESHDAEAVYITTARSQRPIRIARDKLRAAIRHMYVRRTATRKEMERHHAYSSAMLGLVGVVLAGLTKIQRTVRGLLRITMIGTRYFFSGCERDPTALRIIKANGGKMLLMSYFHLRDDPGWLRRIEQVGFTAEERRCVLIDSGAYSLHRAKQDGKDVRPICVEDYADWIKQHRDHLYGWMSLDVIGDEAATRANYEYLCARGLRPIPVVSIHSGDEEFERYVQEDHDIIAIGGVALMLQRSQKRKATAMLRRIVARWPNQVWHLLGCAYIPLLREIGVTFSDSAAAVLAASNKRLITKAGQKTRRDMTKNELTASIVRELVKLEHYGLGRRPQYGQIALQI